MNVKVPAKKNTVRKLTAYGKALAGVVSTLAMAVEAIDTVRHWMQKEAPPPAPMMLPRGLEAGGPPPVLVDAVRPSKSLHLLVLLVFAVPASIYLVHWLGHRLEQHADED